MAKQKNKLKSMICSQVVITGIPMSSTNAFEINDFIKEMSLNNWCHNDGTIGFFGKISGENITPELVKLELEQIGFQFPFLDLGITLFSEEEGYKKIFAGLSLRNGKVKVIQNNNSYPNVHLHHPPPQKKKEK